MAWTDTNMVIYMVGGDSLTTDPNGEVVINARALDGSVSGWMSVYQNVRREVLQRLLPQ